MLPRRSLLERRAESGGCSPINPDSVGAKFRCHKPVRPACILEADEPHGRSEALPLEHKLMDDGGGRGKEGNRSWLRREHGAPPAQALSPPAPIVRAAAVLGLAVECAAFSGDQQVAVACGWPLLDRG